MEGTVLHFNAKTTSPFHSSRKEFANLLKSSSFILGCTIRGAILDYLIRVLCKEDLLNQLVRINMPHEIAEFHRNCGKPCPIRYFFDEKPLIWFSFAEFEQPIYTKITRIGMSRDTRSAAEGSIFNVEAICPGTAFTFSVFLFGPAQEVESLVIDAVKQVGFLNGIGRCRSIGFGLFEVSNQVSTDFEITVTERVGQFPPPSEKLVVTFETPFILGDAMAPVPIRDDLLGSYLTAQICKVASTIRKKEMKPMHFRLVDARMHPEFIGRFSYERGLRENRLVAWPGSSIVLRIEGDQDTDQLSVASVLGIGPWNGWGFGRFSLS